jgi:hypothetical protein
LFHYDFGTFIFGVVLGKAYYIYIGVFLIQDRVIIKVAVIEKGDIVVAFIYIYHF